ncbi:hypothetical protein BH10PLA2_BH10PLA2_22460 [soil metagenome]
MKRLLAVICLVAFSNVATADDKSNPTGTWKYSTEANGTKLEVTMKLKAEGDKLTGTVSVNDTEIKIDDGKFKDGEVSFKIVREAGGQKFEIKYKGKVTGDTFKGKRELERDGQPNVREFEAKRSKD